MWSGCRTRCCRASLRILTQVCSSDDVCVAQPNEMLCQTVVTLHASWSSFQTSLFACCARAMPIKLVDIRHPREPKVIEGEHAVWRFRALTRRSLCTGSHGATLLRWNRIHPFRFASAHEGSVRVWDARVSFEHAALASLGAANQMQRILWSAKAHKTDVSDLDWSPVAVHLQSPVLQSDLICSALPGVRRMNW